MKELQCRKQLQAIHILGGLGGGQWKRCALQNCLQTTGTLYNESGLANGRVYKVSKGVGAYSILQKFSKAFFWLLC